MKLATGLFLSIVALVLVLLTGCDTTPQQPKPVIDAVMPIAPCHAKQISHPFVILCRNGSIWELVDENWLKVSDGPQ